MISTLHRPDQGERRKNPAGSAHAMKRGVLDSDSPARNEGVRKERDRARAHITLGLKCGDTRTVIAALRSGVALTPEIQAQYMSAAINRAELRVRQAETDEAGAAFENIKRPKDAHSDEFGEAVVDRLTDLLGTDEGDE